MLPPGVLTVAAPTALRVRTYPEGHVEALGILAIPALVKITIWSAVVIVELGDIVVVRVANRIPWLTNWVTVHQLEASVTTPTEAYGLSVRLAYPSMFPCAGVTVTFAVLMFRIVTSWPTGYAVAA